MKYLPMASSCEVERSELVPITTNLLKDSCKLPTNNFYWRNIFILNVSTPGKQSSNEQ